MFLKAIGQLLISAIFIQIFPTDAGVLEYSVGVGDADTAIISTEEIVSMLHYLPSSPDRGYPVKVDTDSYGIVTSAWSALVVDASSGVILFQKHPDQLRSIGSVTKLMSALVFLEQNPNLDQIVELDPELDYQGGGIVYLGYYNGVSLRDVLGASLVGSDNTATEALVRFSGLSLDDFVSRMNEKALELGMENTSFYDATGLNAYNMSTARELAILLESAEAQEEISYFMQQQSITVEQANGRTVNIENTNTLLSSFINEYPYKVVGGKTGYLPQAGYVLATSVENEGNLVHIIVLGADSKDARISEAKGLAYWAFKTYKWPE